MLQSVAMRRIRLHIQFVAVKLNAFGLHHRHQRWRRRRRRNRCRRRRHHRRDLRHRRRLRFPSQSGKKFPHSVDKLGVSQELDLQR